MPCILLNASVASETSNDNEILGCVFGTLDRMLEHAYHASTMPLPCLAFIRPPGRKRDSLPTNRNQETPHDKFDEPALSLSSLHTPNPVTRHLF